MKILIMGGTVFLGRHLVESALALGHQVTIFHRGKHNPGLFGNLIEVVTLEFTQKLSFSRIAPAPGLPYQRALIIHQGEIETLLVQPKFEGKIIGISTDKP